MAPVSWTNRRVAEALRETAALLEQQGEDGFRAGAFRKAAATVDTLPRDVHEIVGEEGRRGLMELPGIGRGISAAIVEILSTGRYARLDRLRGELDAVRLFRTIPGIGPKLARRIHDELHVDTLEALEAAAHDGRLDAVPGLGVERVELIRSALAVRLAHLGPRHRRAGEGPEVGLLLAIDALYRERAAAGTLPRIAPRRFNPDREAWLPILHARREGWHFTALYSNTARAHELHRTHDWVIVYFYDDHHVEGQHTIVTESRGPLAGRRVVRGREAECLRHHGMEAATEPR